MGYFLSVMAEGGDAPVDLGDVASTLGWYTFATWAAGLDAAEYGELAALGEEGACRGAEAIARLEKKLELALQRRPGEPSADVLSVGGRLLAELKGRPPGAAEVVVTDGTEGGGDEPEEDDADDGPA